MGKKCSHVCVCVCVYVCVSYRLPSKLVMCLQAALYPTWMVILHAQHMNTSYPELFDRASSSWNKVKYQLDATRIFYWCILSSTCFGYICPSSGALEVELQNMVFCTEFLDGWWSWEPLRRSCCTVRMVHGKSAPYTWPTQLLSRPPPIQKLGAENHILQLNF